MKRLLLMSQGIRYGLLAIFFLSVSFNCLPQSKVRINRGDIRSLLNTWSEAHNNSDLEILAELYGDTLFFYGQNLSKKKCMSLKVQQLSSEYQFQQRVTRDPSLFVFKSGMVKCEFTREITTESEIKNSEVYLLLKEHNGKYLIAGESDRVTDKNLKVNLDLGEQVKLQDIEAIDKPSNEYNIKKNRIRLTSNSLIIGVISIAFVTSLIFLVKRRKQTKETPERSRPGHRSMTSSAKFTEQVTSFSVNKMSKPNPEWTDIPPQRHFVETHRILDNIEKESPLPSEKAKSNKKQIGDDFEEFVINGFDERYFEIVNWRSDKGTKNGRYATSNKYPDLEFKFRKGKIVRIFSVECKYKSKLWRGVFKIEERQLLNYQQFHRDQKIDVYIVVGLGRKPSNPEELFLIPLSHFRDSNGISYQELTKFKKSRKNFFYNVETEVLE